MTLGNPRCSGAKTSSPVRPGGAVWLGYFQPFVGFSDNLIDDCLHVVRLMKNGELTIGARAFPHNAFDVLHLPPAPEFVDFRRDEFQQFVEQVA